MKFQRLLFVMMVPIFGVNAQPNRAQLADYSLLNNPASAYHFERVELEATPPEGLKRVVFIGVAKHSPQGRKLPVLYALDGNALLGVLNLQSVATLAARTRPPILVFLGYDTPKRLAVDERAYDYTPFVSKPGDIQIDALNPHRRNGGAGAYYTWITKTVRPYVEKHYAVDTQNTTLWGHSYGALFVLWAFLTDPGSFSHYVAADPSLWWHDQWLLKNQKRLIENVHLKSPVSLTIIRGLGTSPQPPRPDQARIDALRTVNSQWRDAFFRALESIGSLRLTLQADPRFHHGSLLPASLLMTLDLPITVESPKSDASTNKE